MCFKRLYPDLVHKNIKYPLFINEVFTNAKGQRVEMLAFACTEDRFKIIMDPTIYASHRCETAVIDSVMDSFIAGGSRMIDLWGDPNAQVKLTIPRVARLLHPEDWLIEVITQDEVCHRHLATTRAIDLTV